MDRLQGTPEPHSATRAAERGAAGRRPAPGPRRASARLALLAASLLLLLSAPFAAPAQAQSHCDATDLREVWCATMTVGSRSGGTVAGFSTGIFSFGSLTASTFTWRGVTMRITLLTNNSNTGSIALGIGRNSGTALTDGLLGAGTFTLEFGTGANKTSLDISDPGTNLNAETFLTNNEGLAWSDNDTVAVRLLGPHPTPHQMRLDAPSGTASFLRVRWEAQPGTSAAYHVRAQPTVSSFTEEQRSKYFTDGITSRVGSGARSHTFYKLVPGIAHRAQVCRVTALDDTFAGHDTLGACSPWQTITLPAASAADANDIKVSLEYLQGGSVSRIAVTDEKADSTVAYRVRVSGLNDLSGFDPPFGGGASWALILRASDSTGTVKSGSREIPSYLHYAARGAGLRHINWDRPGSGYVEGRINVKYWWRARAPLTIELLDPQDGDEPLGDQRSLCVEFEDTNGDVANPCPSSGGQQAVDPPTVDGAPVLSGAGDDGTWTAGEKVGVTVAFSEAVDVDTSGGTPTIGVELGGPGGTAKTATYESGSGTTELTFGYTLVEADGDHGTMGVAADSLATGGGTIRGTASDVDASLAHVGTASPGSLARSTGPTARFQDVPERHDGATAFTVGLRFAGAPAGLVATHAASPRAQRPGGRSGASGCPDRRRTRSGGAA